MNGSRNPHEPLPARRRRPPRTPAREWRDGRRAHRCPRRGRRRVQFPTSGRLHDIHRLTTGMRVRRPRRNLTACLPSADQTPEPRIRAIVAVLRRLRGARGRSRRPATSRETSARVPESASIMYPDSPTTPGRASPRPMANAGYVRRAKRAPAAGASRSGRTEGAVRPRRLTSAAVPLTRARPAAGTGFVLRPSSAQAAKGAHGAVQRRSGPSRGIRWPASRSAGPCGPGGTRRNPGLFRSHRH